MTNTEIILSILIVLFALLLFILYRKYNHIKNSRATIIEEPAQCGEERSIEQIEICYKTLLDSIDIGVQMRDMNGQLRYVNQANFDLFGIVDRPEQIPSNCDLSKFTTLAQEDREKMRRFEPVAACVEFDFDKIPEDYCFKTSKKGKITLEIRVVPMYNDQRELIGSIQLWTDITDHIKLLNQYKELYRQQETILSLLPVCVEIYDTDGWLIFQNQAGHKFFGSDTMTHKVNAKKNPNLPKDLIMRAERGENAHLLMKYDFDKIRESNFFGSSITGIRYFDIMGAPITDENGKMIYYACVTQDHTEIIQANKHIEQVNRKLSLAIANSSIIPWDYECKSKTLSQEIKSNKGTRKVNMSGYRSIIHPDYHDRAQTVWQLMNAQRDESFSIEVQFRLATNSEWRYGTISGQPFQYDKNGKVLSYTGFIKDTTRWKSMTNKLEALNKQNRLILDNTKSGFIYFTPDYHVQWENVSSTFSGHSLVEKYKTGVLCYRDIKGLKTPCEGCPLTMAIEKRVSSSHEFCDENGSHFEMLAVPIMEGNKLLGVSMRIDNITERKHINMELTQAKEKAEESNRLKSAFLANMSHEIRTPLNAIVGFSEIILSAETEEERAEFQKIIKTNSETLINLINDILDLSKIESGRIELHSGQLDLNALMDEVRISFTFRLREGVELRVEHAERECIVDGLDKQRVTQILNNFTSNAIKFTSKGSITLGYELVKGGVKLYVSDTGIGIKEEHRGNVFKRFQKLDSFAQGTGLGLSICKAIAEAMNGNVGFESQSGRGSTFWVWLPVK